MALITQTPQQYYQSGNYGNYSSVSLYDIINQFMVIYVGEEKIIQKARRVDVAFHAQRGMQELSYDVFRSRKAQEILIPPSLQMIIPQDYVNYVKLSLIDDAGIKHVLYPASKTSNPKNPIQDADGNFNIKALGDLTNNSTSVTLDDQYNNILVGMTVNGIGIPAGTTVTAVSVPTTVTVLTLSNAITTTQTIFGADLTFSNTDGSLAHLPDHQIHSDQADINVGNFYITFKHPTTGALVDIDALGVKVGDRVSHEAFPSNTVVTDVVSIGAGLVANIVFVSNPATISSATQNEDVVFTSTTSSSTSWKNYKKAAPSENPSQYDDNTYWPLHGERYGLNPEHSQANGSFYIDEESGKIHFSSNLAGKTIVLDYLSDGLGKETEMVVPKLAEEAMYAYITYAIISSRQNTPEYLVRRFKKERFAEVRKAKLRLSNIKLEEITQILRGKSKHIKH